MIDLNLGHRIYNNGREQYGNQRLENKPVYEQIPEKTNEDLMREFSERNQLPEKKEELEKIVDEEIKKEKTFPNKKLEKPLNAYKIPEKSDEDLKQEKLSILYGRKDEAYKPDQIKTDEETDQDKARSYLQILESFEKKDEQDKTN